MKLFSIIAFSLLFGAVGCTQPVLKKIDVAAAKSLLASKSANLQIVDLRTPGEIAETGSLPGAEFIDYTAPNFAQKVKQLDKKRPVLLYCAAGGRSAAAAEILHQQKFQLVYEMSPGMNGWLAAGNQISKNK
ncbi:MAG: rhodanese-like domain-containing protein [Saprospiraceae bacterium]